LTIWIEERILQKVNGFLINCFITLLGEFLKLSYIVQHSLTLKLVIMKTQTDQLQFPVGTRQLIHSTQSGLPHQEGRSNGLASNLTEIVTGLRESLPADLSPNKRAVVDRLITLWAEGALG
jgi:hypothetical protein